MNLPAAVDASDAEVLAAYPGEVVDHDTKHVFRGYLQRRLLVPRCAGCGHWQLPVLPCCPACWSPDLRPTDVSGRGRVYFRIRLHQGPAVPGVDYSRPYAIAAVELDEQPGLRLTAPLVGDTGAIEVGTRVIVDWIERDGVPFPAFRAEDADT